MARFVIYNIILIVTHNSDLLQRSGGISRGFVAKGLHFICLPQKCKDEWTKQSKILVCLFFFLHFAIQVSKLNESLRDKEKVNELFHLKKQKVFI